MFIAIVCSPVLPARTDDAHKEEPHLECQAPGPHDARWDDTASNTAGPNATPHAPGADTSNFQVSPHQET